MSAASTPNHHKEEEEEEEYTHEAAAGSERNACEPPAPMKTGGRVKPGGGVVDVDQLVVEVCVDSVSSAVAAASHGADRLELCCGLVEGGLTPSLGLMRRVIKCVSIPVHVLIRPRGGDFLYSHDEIQVMLEDIHAAKDADGTVDKPLLQRFIRAARPMSVTFHRAIDVCADALAAVAVCVELGVDRILTSGQAQSAGDGVGVIASMVEAAHGSALQIMAGGGCRPSNVGAIVRRTGVREIHGTARADVTSAMVFRPVPPVYMGCDRVNTPDVDFRFRQATPSSVRSFVEAAKTSSS